MNIRRIRLLMSYLLMLLTLLLLQNPIAQASAIMVDCDEQRIEHLLQAIRTVKEHGSITLAPECIYTLKRDSDDDESGLPIITGTITINGNHATIERSPTSPDAFRLFTVEGGTLTLNDLTMQGGHTRGDGGAIVNKQGTVKIFNSTLLNNRAENEGGSVYNDNGTVEMQDCTIMENRAQYFGGGLVNASGTLNITGSTIILNEAEFAGGIYTYGGIVTLTDSTVFSNKAIYGGGGCTIAGEVVLTGNSTISDNQATEYAGGICNYAGTISLPEPETIFNNNATYVPNIYNTAGGKVIIHKRD